MTQNLRSTLRSSQRKWRSFYFEDSERNQLSRWTGRAIYQDVQELYRMRVFEFDDYDVNTKLRSIEEEIKIRMKITAQEIFIIGELLSLAKQLCAERGIRFKLWIIKAFSFSYETANNFMNVYKHCFAHRAVAQFIPISLLYKIGSPSFPNELREYIFENLPKLGSINESIIKKLIEKFKEGGIDAIEGNLTNYTLLNTAKSQVLNSFDQAENTLRVLDSFRDSIRKWGNRQAHISFYGQENKMLPVVQQINQGILKAVESAINTVETALSLAEDQFEKLRKEIEDEV